MGGSSKSVTVGYKYYVGMHMVLCRGPVDYLKEALVDDKSALLGNFGSGTYGIFKEDLFGGESREGGVSGLLDVMGGESTQTVNSYLSSKLGSLVPAFRGVLSVVFRQMYLGVNPYLKKWSFLAQRVHVRQNGLAQWYDAKSAILSNSFVVPPGNNWRYKVLNVGDTSDYHLESYDDSTWDIGYSPFSSKCWSVPATYGFAECPATEVPQQKLVWMRTYFTLTDVPSGGLEFQAFIDNGVEIWINDIKVVDYYNANGVYYTTTIPASALKQGTNFLAAKGRDDKSGVRPGNYFYFDFRIRTQALEMWDMNPAHIIRECLTDPDWGMGYAEADMDDASFTAAADTLYEEGMGMSLLWDTQITIEEFVQLVCKHVNASIYVDRKTGLFVLKLIRQDYDEEDLLVLNPSNVSQVQDFARVQFGELVNSITVSFWNSSIRDTSTVTVTDIALASTQGATINTSVKYDGFTSSDIASRVAQRDLKALSTPLISCTVYANTDAADLNIGDCFKLSWPDYDIEEVIMRVATIGYGDGKSNRVRLTCTQDVFAMPDIAYIAPTPPEGVPSDAAPVAVAARLAMEMPYREAVQQLGQSSVNSNLNENPDIGYFAIAAGRPSTNSLNARLYTDAGGGYQEQVTLDFCPFAKLAADIDLDDTSFTVSDLQDAAEIQDDTVIQIGTEAMQVTSVVGTTVNVKRGVIDTLPTAHTTGDFVFFWDVYLSLDQTQYVAGEAVSGKLATVTGSGVLALSSAPADTVTMASRMYRPYPPAGLSVDGQAPGALPVNGFATLTYRHRDRITQSDQLIDQTAANVGPEVGTTYELTVRRQSDNTLVDSVTGITGTTITYLPSEAGDMKFKLCSKRDGYESWQAWNWNATVIPTFNITGSAPVGMREGVAASWSYGTSGPATPPVTFAVLSGTFPPGLTLDGATGAVTGTPTQGTYEWTIGATDDSGAQAAKTDHASISEPVPDTAAIRRSMRTKIANYWEFNGSNVDAGRAGQNMSSGTLAYVAADNGRNCLAASTTGLRTTGSTNCVGMNLYQSKHHFTFGARIRTSLTDLSSIIAVGTGGATGANTHVVYVSLVSGILRAFVRASDNNLFLLVDTVARDLTQFTQISIDGDGSFFRLRVNSEEVASVACDSVGLKRAGSTGGMFIVGGTATPLGVDVQDLFWAHETLTTDELKYLNNAGLGRRYSHFSSEALTETNYDAFIISKSPVAFYKLNETSGSSVANSAPGSSIGAGSLAGATLASVPAPPGFPSQNSIKFGGGNSGIAIPAIDLSLYGASFALTEFVWLDGSNNYGRYFHLGTTGNNSAITLNQNSTSYGIFSQVFSAAGSVSAMADGTSGTLVKSNFTTGVWKQVTLQYDGSTQALSIWTDGLCVDGGVLSAAPPSVNRTGSYIFRSATTSEGSNGRVSRASLHSATNQQPIGTVDLVKAYLLGMGL